MGAAVKLPVYEDRSHNQWVQIGFKNPDICVFRLLDGDILADVTHKELKKDWLYVGKKEPDSE